MLLPHRPVLIPLVVGLTYDPAWYAWYRRPCSKVYLVMADWIEVVLDARDSLSPPKVLWYHGQRVLERRLCPTGFAYLSWSVNCSSASILLAVLPSG